MQTFQDKVVVITGGAAGIGRAMAQRFADSGAKLVLADVEAAVLAKTEQHFLDFGVDVVAEICDVSDSDAVDALADAAMGRFGAVHVICNNAGVGNGGNSWEIPLDEWKWVIDVDLWGVIHGIHTFVPLIIASGGGHVINTASAAGLGSTPFMGPYNVAKHGVVTLSETMYHELQMSHPEVGVSVVCPGWVKTGIASSERNRRGGARATGAGSGAGEMVGDIVGGLVANGLEAADVAEQVYDAVINDRFYVLTHPDWNSGHLDRVQRIVDGENPKFIMPG